MAVGSSNDFDLVVLGAGTGGYAAAFRASQLGLKVALVDEDKLGGTCLHRGCIPTKALLESAAFAERLRHAADFGLNLPGEADDRLRADGAAARPGRHPACGRASRRWSRSTTSPGSRAAASSTGAHKVRVQMAGDDGTPGAKGERVLNATDVILATGSRVKSLPGIEPDGKRIVTSDDVLKMDTLPGSVIVIGAGAVGVEFASMYHDLGSTVTRARVPAGDRAARGPRRQQGARAVASAGAGSRSSPTPGSTPSRSRSRPTASSSRSGRRARTRTEIEAEILLVAAGRATNVEDVGLETTTAEVDRGIVKVDGHMRTKEPHLYAIGDIVGGLMLAHTAAHEGITAAHTIAGDPDVHAMDYDAAAASHVLPARDRLGRPDRAAVRGAGPADQGRQGAVPGDRQGASSAASTKASPRSSATRRPRTRSASTSSARTRPTSSPRRRWPSTSTRRRGRSAPRPTRTRRSRRSSARPRWRSTAGRSTSSRTRGRRRRSATGHGGSDDGHGSQRPRRDEPPRRLGRPHRRRPRRDVPHGRAGAGGRRADVDPQPRGPDPVRDQRPGPRGRAGGPRLAPAEGPRLDRAVLPLDRHLPRRSG